jgi:hypothetical protein
MRAVLRLLDRTEHHLHAFPPGCNRARYRDAGIGWRRELLGDPATRRDATLDLGAALRPRR